MSQLFKNFKTVFFLLLLCCPTGYAQVAPPQTVNFQGRLTDLSDNPLNGSFDITFTLYNAASGGIALWTETQPGLAVDNGSVEALLGSVTPIPYSAATSPAAYLQIQVGAETLSPRQPFASVLYSMNSAQLSGRTYDMFMDLSSSQTVPGVKTFGTIIATHSVTAARFYGNGSNLTGIIGDSLGDHTAIADLNMSGRSIISVGTVTAYHFVGNGAGLTGISGDNLGSHMASTALDMANYPVNNVSTLTVTNTIMAGKYYGDGSMLTAVRGDNMGNHTAFMPLDMASQDIIAAGNVTAANFYGNGANLSGVPGDNLGNHTATTALNMAGFPISNAVSLTVSSNVTAGKYFGDGSALTGIAGDNLGNHTASADLNMSGRNLVSVGTVTANNFVGNGSGLTGIAGDNLGSHTATMALNMGGYPISNAATLNVSSNVTAGKYFGDGSALTGIAGDNLGNHTASADLNMSGRNLVSVGTVTANNFVGNGAGLSGISGDNLGNHLATQGLNMNGHSIVSVASISVAGTEFSVNDYALAVTGGKVGVGTASPYEMLEIETYGKTVVQVDNGGSVGEAKFRLASADVEKGFMVLMPELSEIRFGGGVGMSAAFHANNIEIMRLASGGNVGIGTANPGAKLDVAGNVKIVDGTQGAGKVLTSDSAGLASWQPVSGDNLGSHIAGTALDMAYHQVLNVTTMTVVNAVVGGYFVGNGSGLTNLNAVAKTGDSMTGALNFSGAVPDIMAPVNEHITIMPSGSGNVGIGEGNPVAKLTVSGDVRATGNLTLGTGGPATLSVGAGSGESVLAAPDNQTLTIKGTREAGLGNAFQVQTYNAAKSSFVDRFTVNGATDNANISMLNSNVGIGTINPANQFVLAHGAGVMNKVFLDGTIDDGSGVAKRVVSLSNTDGSNYGGYLALGNRYSPLTGPADGATVLLSGAPNQNSYISVGNVGIGTTTPGAKLHVAGNVKIADGTQGAGKVLTSDSAGLASWQPSAGDNLGSHIAGTALDMAGFPISNAASLNVSGSVSAMSFSGDGSGLTGINPPGDNLGNHTAMQDLGMGGFNISSVGNITGSGAVALTAGGIGALDLLAGNTLSPGQTGGAVTIAAGGGYNAPGAGVKVSAGLTSTWSAAGSSAAVVLDGGPSDSPATSAQLKVHGKISSGSGMEYNPGGPVEIIGGNGNAAQGGNIILMPGAGSPDGNVGVGTSSPGAKLEVAGNVKIADGTQGAGKVLTSDSVGLASWQTPDFGDNLGSHLASTNLDMANNAILNAGGVTVNGAVTAESYLTAGTTILAVLNGTGSLGVGGNAGRVNTGLYNSFMGTGAGFANTTGAGNSFVGYHAGYGNIIGGSNTFIGYSAGAAATGTGNIVIGASQDTQSPASNDQMNIGGVLYGDLYGKALGINGYGSKAALTIWPSYISGYNANSQVWNSGAGIAVATMTTGGVLHAVSFVGNGSGLTGISGDNLGSHTATTNLNMGGFAINSAGDINGAAAIKMEAGGIGALQLLAGNTLTPGQTGGAVTIAAGGGYNMPGAGVKISAGLSSTWSAAGSSSAVVLDGGPSDSPATSAQLKVHGKISAGSGSPSNPGGPVEIIGGNGSSAPGGNIILMPGAGSMAGSVGIGTYSPGTTLHVLSQSNNIATFASPSAVSSVLTIQNDAVTEQRTMINFNSWSSGNSGLRSMGNIGFVPGGHISIETSNNGNTGGERLRITATGDIGIGTASPGAKLEVAGNVKIADGTQGAGKVLTSDSAGLASWQAAGGADNLGNHTATTNLNMGSFAINSAGDINGTSAIKMEAGGIGALQLLAGNTLTPGQTGGAVTMAAGGGYNAPGAGVKISAGLTSTWAAVNSSAAVVLDGGPSDSPSTSAQIKVHGKISAGSGSANNPGGPVEILGGNGNSAPGGNIILMPGLGSTTGNVGVGLYNPGYRLDVQAAGSAPSDMAQVWRNSGGTIVSSVSATGVVTASKFVSPMGGSTGQTSPIGLAGLNLGTQATTGTAEEALLSYTLPANSLNANGKGVRIKAWGTSANNSMTKILRLRFGGIAGTIVASHTSMSENGWALEAVVFRTGVNTQKGLGLSLVSQETIVSAPGQTETAAIDVLITGETSITLGEVSAEGLMVEYIN